MSYQLGDCLVLPGLTGGYIVAYVAGANEQSYFLSFLDFEGEVAPTPAYFEACSFFVTTFGPQEKEHVAFDTVIIEKSLLEHAPEVSLAAHLEIGAIGQMGLTPMSGMADVGAFFDENFANFPTKPAKNIFQPFARSIMPLAEIKKKAAPVNPFRTVKLYKQAGATLQFWHIYGGVSPAALVTCWGPLGKYDDYAEIKGEDMNSLKERYLLLIEEKKRDGYQERENYEEMILQFHTNDEWGDTDDLAFRNQIWDSLNEQLFWSGLGEVAGGDIGSGTVNLFFRTLSSVQVVPLINALLEAKQIRRPYLIACENDDNEQRSVKVIYPVDHAGEFNY